MIKTINIIGSGNVGTHLALYLKDKVNIKTIFSQSIVNAEKLADKINSKPINHLADLHQNVDLNLICVKDDIIGDLAVQLPINIPVVHTSGSISINVLSRFTNYGILYPLQTFSKTSRLDVGAIPFLIEASSDYFYDELYQFCINNLSSNIIKANSDLRQQIHLSAVISNNFMTALLVESEKILKKNNLSLQLIKPLVQETINKSFNNSPLNAQTGPAKRKDLQIIKKQINLIDNDKLKQIYQLISELIIEQQSTNF